MRNDDLYTNDKQDLADRLRALAMAQTASESGELITIAVYQMAEISGDSMLDWQKVEGDEMFTSTSGWAVRFTRPFQSPVWDGLPDAKTVVQLSPEVTARIFSSTRIEEEGGWLKAHSWKVAAIIRECATMNLYGGHPIDPSLPLLPAAVVPLVTGKAPGDGDPMTISVYQMPALDGADSGWRIRLLEAKDSAPWDGRDDAHTTRVPVQALAESLFVSAEFHLTGFGACWWLPDSAVRNDLAPSSEVRLASAIEFFQKARLEASSGGQVV